MNIVIWVLQVLLAGAFLGAGAIKATQPREKLKARMAYVEDFSDTAVKAIGITELLAVVGLILPAVFGVATILVPLAALGLVIAMVCAVIVHLRRNEANQIAVPVALLILAAVVAWARFGPYSL